MLPGQPGPIDSSSAERLGLELYAKVRRSSAERLLQEPTTTHWNGDLVVGRHAAMLFANLDNKAGRWQLYSPTQLRMHERRSDRSPVRSWRPYLPNLVIHAFALPSRGLQCLYLGTAQPGTYGCGISGAFGKSIHLDCKVQPPLPDHIWQELYTHRLEIDGQVIEHGPDGELLWPGTLGEVLDPLRRRRRAQATIHRRGLGKITYSKHDRSRVLRYTDRGGHTREARATWEQGAQDALWLFWTEGLLAPWLEWL